MDISPMHIKQIFSASMSRISRYASAIYIHVKRVRLNLLGLAFYIAVTSVVGNTVLFDALAAAADAAAANVTIGSYNVLTDRWTGTGYSGRASKIASNIKSLGMDIVGLQEYESARGASKIIDELGSDWDVFKDNGGAPAQDGFGLAYAWDKTKVKLVGMESKVSVGAGAGCGGGSSTAIIAHFQTTAGKDLYVGNHHGRINRSDSCARARADNIEKVIKALNKFASRNASVFLVGDTNSWSSDKEGGVYPKVKSLGWAIADETATTKTGPSPGTKTIDRIFYNPDTVSAPSSYARSDCSTSPSGSGSCGSDHKPVAATFGGSASADSTPLIIGTASGSSCANGHDYQQRMETTAENIIQLGYHVVGVTEYNHDSCFGTLLSDLNALGGSWQNTVQTGKDYTANQASILWDANYVTMVGEEIFDMDTPGNTKTNLPGHDSSLSNSCGGGSRYVHIARFRTGSGQSFLVANGHYLTGCGGERNSEAAKHGVKEVTNVIDHLKNETDTVFLTGDTNASMARSIDNEFYATVKAAGYSLAIETAAEKKNEKWGSMYDSSTSSQGMIDQVFYRSTSAPSYYETFGCKAWATCGSDHRPIKSVFPGILVGGACGGSNDALDATSTNDYRARNNQLLTGSRDVCCDTGTATSSENTVLQGSTNAEKAFNFLTTTSIASNGGKPLNAAQAAGMVGNLMDETGGGTYDLKTDAINSIGAAGIVQWRGDRRTALNAFAQKKGTDWTDLRTQLQFLIVELESDYYTKQVMEASAPAGKDVNTGLKNVTDVSEAGARTAANVIARHYEIPSISDDYTGRKNNAAKAFSDFGGSAKSATSASASCSKEEKGDFASTVKSFAWEDGRRGAEQKGGASGPYATAVKSSAYGNDAAHNYGNDCGAFIYILMRESGFEPKYIGGWTGEQHTWLEDNWDHVKFSSGKVDVGELRPGDVAWKTGHVFVWIGDVEGFVGKSAEAAVGSNTAPTAIKSDNTYSDPSLYTWYRKKAN